MKFKIGRIKDKDKCELTLTYTGDSSNADLLHKAILNRLLVEALVDNNPEQCALIQEMLRNNES
jgi:hypothetical protein